MTSIRKQAWKNQLMDIKEEESSSSFLWCIHQSVNNPNWKIIATLPLKSENKCEHRCVQ
jgi:hypothetical protein